MRVNNWISFICVMSAIAIGVAIAVMLSDIATMKAAWCDARPACFRDWVDALSGWIAAAAAAATIFVIRGQILQASEFRREDESKRNSAALQLVVVDLVESAERLGTLKGGQVANPPLARISEQMIPDIAAISPYLAIALHKHVNEVRRLDPPKTQNANSHALASSIRPVPGGPSPTVMSIRAIALATCCGVVSRRLQTGETLEPPFTDLAAVQATASEPEITREDIGYLQNLVS